jgi:hypothetical protein
MRNTYDAVVLEFDTIPIELKLRHFNKNIILGFEES